MEMLIWIVMIILVTLILLAILAHLYTIVPADFADVVVQKGQMRVLCAHKDYSLTGKSAYFKIPEWFFLFGLGMKVHRIPLRILPIDVPNFLAFDADRARFICNIIAYVVVNNPIEAAKRFAGNLAELEDQVRKVVQATTRDATTKKTVREIINNREEIIKMIAPPLQDAIKNWGIELRDIELVEFQDPTKAEYGEKEPPHVIADISSIIEKQINSEARQKNADQEKLARLKEAMADEDARKREIQRDEEVSRREMEKDRRVAEAQKTAVQEQLEVVRVDQVKSAEIQKEKAIVVANQDKDVESINKERKLLEGQGDKLMMMEQAQGEAAPIREKGYADADAKMKLQEALNKYGDRAIIALVAEKLVEMQRQIGIESAKALTEADVKVFAGGPTARAGFDLGQMVEAIGTASDASAISVLNRLGRPNDLGFRELMGVIAEMSSATKEEKETRRPSSKEKSGE